MEFIGNNPNAFRLLLRERSGDDSHHRFGLRFGKTARHAIFDLKIIRQFSDKMLSWKIVWCCNSA
jgi:hypothetical protein